MTRTFGEFNREFEASILAFGPWSPGCKGHTERVAQLRCLAGLAAVYLGSDHELVSALRDGEHDPMRFTQAQVLFEQLPAWTRRKMLSTFSMVTFRKPQS